MRRSIGITHLGVQVKDHDAAVAKMNNAGATIIRETPQATKNRAEMLIRV